VAREKWSYSRAFIDRYGTYLFTDDVALAIKSYTLNRLTGIVHVCGEEVLSMYELAKIISPEVEPMTISDYNGPPLTINMTLRSIRIPPFKLRRSTLN
jgi:dTDP-4-dehydrorhamnose reductase